MSTTILERRLLLEQRLLASLFLWPRPVELGPEHFEAPAHAAFFEALMGVGELLWKPGGWQLLVDALSACNADMFTSCGGPLRFANEVLPLEYAKESDISALTPRVRCCPRCGR